MSSQETATSPPEPTADPRMAEASRHRALASRVAGHVRSLLGDRRFVVPTSFGPRPIASLKSEVRPFDQAVAIKKRMVERGIADFELQEQLPAGEGFDVRLTRQVFLAFTQTLGHVRFATLPPTDALLEGRDAAPLTAQQVREQVAMLPPPEGREIHGPMTLILFSSSGFAPDARRIAREFVDGPPTILIEPNEAGGFDVIGPPGSEPLQQMLDPEEEPEQRKRAREAMASRRVELLTGGLGLDRIAQETHLPLGLVEAEARAMARDSGEPLRVKVIEGVPMLYRDTSVAGNAGKGPAMPLMDGIRKLFGGSGDRERKIALLAERRAALSRQRDAAYEELGALEQREGELREQFKTDAAIPIRRRITSQILQLQKDIERRHQSVAVLNQQINIIGTDLHNLEIARQGTGATLPSSDEIADHAAKAEEVLADLQTSSELADELAGGMSAAGMSAEEQALFEQLSAEAAGAAPAPEEEPTIPLPGPGLKKAQREAAGREKSPASREPAAPEPAEPAQPGEPSPARREAEPG